ncbi:sulfatase, partial [bacterium]|nr:sulfatase [bacterium]
MSSKRNSPPHVILIVIDALRAKNLGCYGGSSQASPHIDKLADNGILFENVYSSWNTTDQSLTSIFSGKHPRSHGIVHHGDKVHSEDLSMFENLDVPWMPQILRDQGYKTWAVDWMGRWFKKGFDYYGYKLNQSLLKQIIYYTVTLPLLYIKYMMNHLGIIKIYSGKRRFSLNSLIRGLKRVLKTFSFMFQLARLHDSAFVRKVGEDLIKTGRGENFFLFLHFWDTHTPYNCPRKFFEKNKNSDLKDGLISKYHGAVSYVDQQVGRLVETLDSLDILDETLIIITSDHGESLTEHGIYFDHHGLYEVTTHVPLILYYPKYFSVPKRVKGFVQHVDLLPTLCDITGSEYKNGLDGMNLLPLIKGDKKRLRNYVYKEESL